MRRGSFAAPAESATAVPDVLSGLKGLFAILICTFLQFLDSWAAEIWYNMPRGRRVPRSSRLQEERT